MNERSRTAGSAPSTGARIVDRTGVGRVLDTRSKLDTALLELSIDVDVCSLLSPLEVALAGARRRQSWIAASQQDLDHFKRPQGA